METQTQTQIERRDPATVMRLSRLGSLHQCRLSFMRQLTRRMARENWSFTRPVFDIDAKGVGRAVYTAHGPERAYSLVAFAHDLPPEQRSDRVIAEAWDATFALFDGIPTEADIERLSQNVPLQEAGRVSESELSLSRANRSVRLWEHVVDALAAGQQPDTAADLSGRLPDAHNRRIWVGQIWRGDRENSCTTARNAAPPFRPKCCRFSDPRVRAGSGAAYGERQGGDQAANLDPRHARIGWGLAIPPALAWHRSSSTTRSCSTTGSWHGKRRLRVFGLWKPPSTAGSTASAMFSNAADCRFHGGGLSIPYRSKNWQALKADLQLRSRTIWTKTD